MAYSFVWKHGNNFIQFPVKINKSVDSDYGISGKLICPGCEKPVKQVYECVECGWKGSVGNINKRYDSENAVVYDNDKKKAFMKAEIDQVIKVVEEIPIAEVILNLEFVTEFYELYNNDTNAKPTVNKIHKWLLKNKKVLVASFGYREKNRSGLIIPTKNKLILAEIRDYRLVRTPKQQELAPVQSGAKELLEGVTKNKEPEMYQAFIDKIRNGEEIPVEIVEQTPQVIVQASFLDE